MNLYLRTNLQPGERLLQLVATEVDAYLSVCRLNLAEQVWNPDRLFQEAEA